MLWQALVQDKSTDADTLMSVPTPRREDRGLVSAMAGFSSAPMPRGAKHVTDESAVQINGEQDDAKNRT